MVETRIENASLCRGLGPLFNSAILWRAELGIDESMADNIHVKSFSYQCQIRAGTRSADNSFARELDEIIALMHDRQRNLARIQDSFLKIELLTQNVVSSFSNVQGCTNSERDTLNRLKTRFTEEVTRVGQRLEQGIAEVNAEVAQLESQKAPEALIELNRSSALTELSVPVQRAQAAPTLSQVTAIDEFNVDYGLYMGSLQNAQDSQILRRRAELLNPCTDGTNAYVISQFLAKV